MAHRAVIYLLFCAYGVFHKGASVLIETEQTVVASVGKEAFLNCQLTQSKDVLQVTWQKLLPKGEDNVATCNKYFGQRVNPGFQGKVAFEAAGLQNSSIVIRNVVEQDEGCYLCMFNTYPEGAFTATTCLKLYELHGPVLHVGRSNSTGEATVSCSVTSRPAPTVTLSVLQPDLDFSNYSSVSVTNPNGTVTVTKTAVLSGFHDNSTQVECAVQVLSVAPVTVFKMIPQVELLSDGVFEKFRSRENDTNFRLVIACVSVAVGLCSVALITVVLCVLKEKKRLSNRDLEEIKTPQRTVQHPHEVKTPLLQDAEDLSKSARERELILFSSAATFHPVNQLLLHMFRVARNILAVVALFSSTSAEGATQCTVTH